MKWLLRLWLLAMGLVFLLGLLLMGLVLFVISMFTWALTGRRPNILVTLNRYKQWQKKAQPWAKPSRGSGGDIIDAEVKAVKETPPPLPTNSSKGTVTITEPAMMVPQGISKAVAPAIKEIATGTVRSVSLTTKVNANINSFHAPMKAS